MAAEPCELPVTLSGTVLAIYSGVAVVAAWLCVRMALRDRRLSVPLAFLGLTEAFLLLRVVWVTLHGFALGSPSCHSEATFVLQRAGFCLYFGALALLLVYWAEQYHRSVFADDSLPRGVTVGLVVANVVMAVYQLVVVVLWLAGDQTKEGDALYDSNILVDMTVVAALAVAFGIYGLMLWWDGRSSGDTSEWHVFEGRLFLVGTLTMVTFFAARVFVFSWRFVAETPLPLWAFYVFGYVLPEVGPLSVQLYVTQVRRDTTVQGTLFIEQLYKDAADSGHLSSFAQDAPLLSDESGLPSPIHSRPGSNNLDLSVTPDT